MPFENAFSSELCPKSITILLQQFDNGRNVSYPSSQTLPAAISGGDHVQAGAVRTTGPPPVAAVDPCFGRVEEVKIIREQIKQVTLEKRRQQHRQGVQDRLTVQNESFLILTPEMSH